MVRAPRCLFGKHFVFKKNNKGETFLVFLSPQEMKTQKIT
jgi:hypothetical protein